MVAHFSKPRANRARQHLPHPYQLTAAAEAEAEVEAQGVAGAEVVALVVADMEVGAQHAAAADRIQLLSRYVNNNRMRLGTPDMPDEQL